MGLKRRNGDRRIENIEWTVPLHTGTFKHLAIEVPHDADGVILAKLNGSGLQPFGLLMPHQIDPDRVAEILRTERDVSQVVAIPFRHEDKIDLVKSFNVVETVGYDAEPCSNRPLPEPESR